MAKYEIKDGVGIIPEGTTIIESKAFCNSKELTSVVIPDTVTEIGESAFEDCTGLTNVVIPDSVTSIHTLRTGIRPRSLQGGIPVEEVRYDTAHRRVTKTSSGGGLDE